MAPVTSDTLQRSLAAARRDVRTYKGIGVSPGIAIGRAVIIEKREASVYRVPIRDEEVVDEVGRFNAALEKTRDELLDLKHKVSRSMGDEYAQIFEAHAMIVTDPSFMDKVVDKIENEQVNAEWAVAEVQEELQARFNSFEDSYLRERVADVKDVGDAPAQVGVLEAVEARLQDRKSTRLNSSHMSTSYAVFCLKK